MAPRSIRGAALRRGARGAVFVEALIVISSLVLFFIGIVYVGHLYAQQLHVLRATRAAGLAFATSGCQDGAKVMAALPPADAKVLAPPQAAGAAETGGLVPDRSSRALSKQPKATTALNDTMKDTGFGLPRLGAIDGQEDVGTVGHQGLLGAALPKTVRSSTGVLCNEPNKAGSVGGAVTHVMEFFQHTTQPKAGARGAGSTG